VRILQVTPGYYPAVGGVERHVQAISERLVHLGHEVTVLTMGSGGSTPRRDVIAGVRIHRFPSVGFGNVYRIPVGLLPHLLRVSASFDIVHVHNYHAILMPLVAATRPACMVVTPHLNDRAHSNLAQVLHYPYASLGRWCLQQARAVICVSAAERSRLMSRLQFSSDRISVIPNGIDGERLRSADTSTPKNPLLILVVGRLEGYKRVDRLIEAMAVLPPPYQLVVVGEGSQHRFLKRHAVTRGVADRVHFVGAVSDEQLATWYQQAQVLVTLSTAEAFGLTVIEAVSAACQVVCRDVPAFRELAARFPDHISLVADDQGEVLLSALQRALHRTGRERVDLDEFNWNTLVERLVALYQQLLDSAHTASPCPLGAA
jgi:glycosyltransferase involved in cell wall biosynthesis